MPEDNGTGQAPEEQPTANAAETQGVATGAVEAPEAVPEQPEAADAAADGQTSDPAPVDDDSGEADSEDDAGTGEVAFSWQASEYVQHYKGMSWYMGLAAVLAVLIGGSALLRSWLAILVFGAMGGAIFVYARKPPRTLAYELTSKGITIDGALHSFQEFRSFGVIEDPEWHTIDLEPTKRFSPRLWILFDPKDLDSIVSHLELHLPRADRQLDLIETASRYLRF